jgi:hypothetical protein
MNGELSDRQILGRYNFDQAVKQAIDCIAKRNDKDLDTLLAEWIFERLVQELKPAVSISKKAKIASRAPRKNGKFVKRNVELSSVSTVPNAVKTEVKLPVAKKLPPGRQR